MAVQVDLPPDIARGAAHVNEAMKSLSPEKREAIADILLKGFCRHCWFPDPEGTCNCWNDE